MIRFFIIIYSYNNRRNNNNFNYCLKNIKLLLLLLITDIRFQTVNYINYILLNCFSEYGE